MSVNDSKPGLAASATNAPAPHLSLDLEPNPFELSFKEREKTNASTSDLPHSTNGTNIPQYIATPGGRRHILPPVASLSSPQPLHQAQTTPTSAWMNSLRSGPLSPAMLQGPQSSLYSNRVQDSAEGGIIRPGPLSPFASTFSRGILTPGASALFNTPGSTTAAILNLTSDQLPLIGTTGLTPLGLTATSKDRPSSPSTRDPKTTLFRTTDPTDAATSLYMLSRSSETEPVKETTTAKVGEKRSLPESKAKQGRSGSSKRSKENHKNSTASKVKKEPVEESPTSSSQTPVPRQSAGNTSKKTSAKPSIDFQASPEQPTSPFSGGNRKKQSDEEKRKSFLERNRVAALKCRQRKKQWLENLQARVEYYSSENENLNAQVSNLREQILSLKSILMQHKDCPIGGGMSQEVFATLLNTNEPAPSTSASTAISGRAATLHAR